MDAWSVRDFSEAAGIGVEIEFGVGAPEFFIVPIGERCSQFVDSGVGLFAVFLRLVFPGEFADVSAGFFNFYFNIIMCGDSFAFFLEPAEEFAEGAFFLEPPVGGPFAAGGAHAGDDVAEGFGALPSVEAGFFEDLRDLEFFASFKLSTFAFSED